MIRDAPVMPARREGLALHLAQPTGRGYKALCGRELAGEDVEVPMPRFPRSRRHVMAHWDRVWEHELVCASCDRISARKHP